jgi:phosphocarrier protein
MIARTFTIINKLGLHARAAAKFVATAAEFDSDIQVAREDKPEHQVSGKSIMGMMMLAAAKDSQIIVSANGEDAEAALEKIGLLINDYFEEGE